MMISQTKALTDAQPQPFASSSPNKARRRGTAVPGSERLLRHRPPSSSASGRRRRHWAVRVPVMVGWTVQRNGYVPAVSAGTW